MSGFLQNKKRLYVAVAAVAVVVVAVVAAHGGAKPDERVAARVGEAVIYEEAVTQRVALLREGKGITEDETWRMWLSDQNLDPEGLRAQVLDELVRYQVATQAAEAQKIEIPYDDLRAELDAMRQDFDDQYGEGEWDKGIAENGMDYESVLQNMTCTYVESKLSGSLSEFQGGLDIQVNPMPQDVPYA